MESTENTKEKEEEEIDTETVEDRVAKLEEAVKWLKNELDGEVIRHNEGLNRLSEQLTSVLKRFKGGKLQTTL